MLLCLHSQLANAALCAQADDNSSDDEDDYDDDEDPFDDDDYYEEDDGSMDNECCCPDCMAEREHDVDACFDGWETASGDEADGAGHGAQVSAMHCQCCSGESCMRLASEAVC